MSILCLHPDILRYILLINIDDILTYRLVCRRIKKIMDASRAFWKEVARQKLTTDPIVLENIDRRTVRRDWLRLNYNLSQRVVNAKWKWLFLKKYDKAIAIAMSIHWSGLYDWIARQSRRYPDFFTRIINHLREDTLICIVPSLMDDNNIVELKRIMSLINDTSLYSDNGLLMVTFESACVRGNHEIIRQCASVMDIEHVEYNIEHAVRENRADIVEILLPYIDDDFREHIFDIADNMVDNDEIILMIANYEPDG